MFSPSASSTYEELTSSTHENFKRSVKIPEDITFKIDHSTSDLMNKYTIDFEQLDEVDSNKIYKFGILNFFTESLIKNCKIPIFKLRGCYKGKETAKLYSDKLNKDKMPMIIIPLEKWLMCDTTQQIEKTITVGCENERFKHLLKNYKENWSKSYIEFNKHVQEIKELKEKKLTEEDKCKMKELEKKIENEVIETKNDINVVKDINYKDVGNAILLENDNIIRGQEYFMGIFIKFTETEYGFQILEVGDNEKEMNDKAEIVRDKLKCYDIIVCKQGLWKCFDPEYTENINYANKQLNEIAKIRDKDKKKRNELISNMVNKKFNILTNIKNDNVKLNTLKTNFKNIFN